MTPSLISLALRPRRHARHAKPSAAAPVLLAGGMTAAIAVTDASLVAGAASAGGSVAQFERLAQCESGGSWSINTGNGYYGGLQFALGTWRGLGYGGYPHQASKATQISAGQKLHSRSGWSPWPACSRKLGLSGNGGYSGSGSGGEATTRQSAPKAAKTTTKTTTRTTTAQRREAAARASRSRAASKAAREAAAQARAARIAAIRALEVTAPPRFDGHVLTIEDRATYRIAVKHWQRRMAARGWTVAVDGRFGPQSARVAAAFARQFDVTTGPGTVDKQLWDLAWSSPVKL